MGAQAKASKKTILVADDDTDIRKLLTEFLEGEGFTVIEASNGNQVIDILVNKTPDLTLLDVRMPDIDGLTLLQRVQDQGIEAPIIMMTAYGSGNVAIKAMQSGAYDYITKPFNELEDVLITINRFFDHEQLTSEIETLRQELVQRDPSDRIIGNSAVMQEVFKTIGLVARTPTTVLISGETGTGKELVAETIHVNSTYRKGPLIKVNCAALPETLLESELFGHEKGAFTGAVAQHKGRFEAADKGTIFLDEVGEMTLGTQKKLLRVLQEREFERVGGNVPVKVDVRVIAATNRILRDEVAANRFREDLYYRLNVIEIHTPPLRARKDDIPQLVAYFLDKYRYSPTSAPTKISEAALNKLQDYDWPGNVRELQNVIERAVVRSQGNTISPQHIILSTEMAYALIDLEQKVKAGTPLNKLLRDVESEAIEVALRQTMRSTMRAAKLLGITESELQSKVLDYKLQTVLVGVESAST